jgi:hypothetical protein
LREIALRVDIVAFAGAGEGTEDRGGVSAAFVADEEVIFS